VETHRFSPRVAEFDQAVLVMRNDIEDRVRVIFQKPNLLWGLAATGGSDEKPCLPEAQQFGPKLSEAKPENNQLSK